MEWGSHAFSIELSQGHYATNGLVCVPILILPFIRIFAAHPSNFFLAWVVGIPSLVWIWEQGLLESNLYFSYLRTPLPWFFFCGSLTILLLAPGLMLRIMGSLESAGGNAHPLPLLLLQVHFKDQIFNKYTLKEALFFPSPLHTPAMSNYGLGTSFSIFSILQLTLLSECSLGFCSQILWFFFF